MEGFHPEQWQDQICVLKTVGFWIKTEVERGKRTLGHLDAMTPAQVNEADGSTDGRREQDWLLQMREEEIWYRVLSSGGQEEFRRGLCGVGRVEGLGYFSFGHKEAEVTWVIRAEMLGRQSHERLEAWSEAWLAPVIPAGPQQIQM